MLDTMRALDAGVARLPLTALPGLLCNISYQCNILQHHCVTALHCKKTLLGTRALSWGHVAYNCFTSEAVNPLQNSVQACEP